MFAASKTASVSGGYQISRSLRFNSADSAYLDRTLTTPTNSQKWTFSEWIKRSSLSSNQFILQAGNSVNNEAQWYFQTDNTIRFYQYTGSYQYDFTTVQVFRDPSAWYHLVVQYDSTQATAANRFIVYINGSQITLTTSTSVSLNATNSKVNSAVSHDIGGSNIEARWSNVYLTEINFIDGQALTPSSFGQTNAQTGVWEPIAYAGTYGTNGFYLNFSDNSNTTAATLGKDYSGNGNNFTPNNFSVTAGAGNDSMVDVPTPYGVDTGAGGTVRGNYSTWSPLANLGLTLTNGNLSNSYTTTSWTGTTGTMAMDSGTWYFEYTVSATATYTQIGVIGTGRPLPTGGFQLQNGTAYAWTYQTYGGLGNNSTYITSGITSATTNDIIMVAVDVSNGKIWFGKNGTWFNSGSPSTGANAAYTNLSGSMIPAIYSYGTESGDTNFGQRPFAYTAPSGFKALCTQNLPTPTIGATTATQAGKYFNAVTYTGTGSSLGVTGVGFQPDWVWVKGRSGATDHSLYDAVRGVQKQLESNTTDSETTETTGLTAFGSDGFTTGALAQINTSAATYVAWNWKANGAGSTNTAGTITSTVSANTTAGFSVLTYQSNGTSGATIGHGLGATPALVIVIKRNAVHHPRVGTSAGASASAPIVGYLTLTNALGVEAATFTSFNSTTIVVGNGGDSNSTSGDNYVMYCFAPIASYSAIGSYTGNGSADGPFVYTGFRPRYILIKATTSFANSFWMIFDTSRNTYNRANAFLRANLSDAEGVGFGSGDYLDILSNGFKLTSTPDSLNGSAITYFYMAFAENPFKYSLAR
jgi:hypothetical protein